MAIGPDGTGIVNGYHIGPGAKLHGANLEKADLRGANLRGAELTSAKLRDARLYNADLRGANLCSARLMGAKLMEANFTGARLRLANLSNAILVEANLEGADLTNANLQRADLTGADLTAARLSRADLRGADINVASMIGVSLNGARVDPEHIPIIESSYRITLRTLRVSPERSYEDTVHYPPVEAYGYPLTRRASPDDIAAMDAAMDAAAMDRALFGDEEDGEDDGRTSNPGYGYNYEADPYDDLSGGFGYARMTNPGHRHHRRGYGR